MELLEYYNIMLTAVRQESINDTETQDYEVSQLGSVLDQAKKEILTKYKFKFNAHLQTFTASNGEVRIPKTILRFVLPAHLDGRVVERQRGEPLWDVLQNVAYNQDVTAVVWDNTDYPMIPEPIANWIAWRAAELFSFKINGAADPDLGYIRNEATRAKQKAMNSERRYIDGTFGFNEIVASFNKDK
jgi:hypothetical protein